MSGKGGLARGRTGYGVPDFALYLRRSFARSMGYSRELLALRSDEGGEACFILGDDPSSDGVAPPGAQSVVPRSGAEEVPE